MSSILLVDSDSECLQSSAESLTRLGHAVIAVESGPSALTVIREGMPIDLVISDYAINGLTGLEMLAAIKRCAPSIPVIMTAKDVTIETYLKALSLGVFEYLHKPLKADEVGRSVKKALERNNISDQASNVNGDFRRSFLKRTA
jgi:DNA-binding NtrC family response regulator